MGTHLPQTHKSTAAARALCLAGVPPAAATGLLAALEEEGASKASAADSETEARPEGALGGGSI